MNWTVILITAAAFVLIETVVIWLYRWTQKNMPEQSLWVIMGSKVLKLILAAVAIIAVYAFSDDIEIKHFSFGVITAYLISLVFETIFFLKKKK